MFIFYNIKDYIIENLDNNAYIENTCNKNDKLYKDILPYDNNSNSFLNMEKKMIFVIPFLNLLKR